MKLATLCYVRRQGKTLMVHRIKKQNDMHQGKWNGLGGKMEPGETPEECVRREVREESGLELDDLVLKGFLTFPEFSKGEDWYAFVFTARSDHGDLIDSPEGHLEWIDNEKLIELELWEGDHFFFPWLERFGFFSAKFCYKNGRLVEQSAVLYE